MNFCQGRVGEVVKGQVLIDEYGDNIQATVLAGDHYRTRHDAFKHHVSDACRWVGNGHGVRRGGAQPVFRADTALQQQGLSRAEKARQYQGIVPDLRIKMPGVGRGQGQGAPGLPAGGLAGQASSVLHEVKVISSSRTRYNPTWQKRAVDVRADQLQGEYVTKARLQTDARMVLRQGWGGWSRSSYLWGRFREL